MKTIYIDSEFRCHPTDDGTMTAIETDAFDGKCHTYIEGYRLVPSGSTWVRPDGVAFSGEMVAPWKPWRELDDAQREYEREQYATLSTENTTLTAQLADLDEEYEKGVNSL